MTFTTTDADCTGTLAASKMGGRPRRRGCCCRGVSWLGVLWIILTAVTAIVSCVGFYMPYWLEGTMRETIPASLGLWRRCNYLRAANDSVDVIFECGRYSGFFHIPSVWWQVATVTCGVGSVLQLVTTFFTLFGCCCGVLTKRSTRACAFLQLTAGVTLSVGCCLYPLGWKSAEVQSVCGPTADVYHHGSCSIQWAFWATVSAATASFLCAILACHACRPPHKPLVTVKRLSRDNYMPVAEQH